MRHTDWRAFVRFRPAEEEWTREKMALAIQTETGWNPLPGMEGGPHWWATFAAVEIWCRKRDIESMLYWRTKDQCWTAVVGEIPCSGDTAAWALVRALYAAIRAEKGRQ